MPIGALFILDHVLVPSPLGKSLARAQREPLASLLSSSMDHDGAQYSQDPLHIEVHTMESPRHLGTISARPTLGERYTACSRILGNKVGLLHWEA